MKITKNSLLGLICAAVILASSRLDAAEAKTYQVTGPVLELTPSLIVVQKGDEKWEVSRNTNTRITGDLKVGSKVTIQYRMIAADVEVKDSKVKEKKEKK